MQGAQIVGDKDLIITASDTIPPHQCNVIVPWDRQLLEKIRRSSILGHLDTHLFGRSGKWGVASYWDNYFIVAGANDFMDLFARKAGGSSAIKARFLEYSREDWPIRDTELKKRILTKIGWNTQ